MTPPTSDHASRPKITLAYTQDLEQRSQVVYLERATGFEPVTASLEGWNSTTELRPPGCRMTSYVRLDRVALDEKILVGRQGFEPWKPMATDLQSAPFVHLGTCPFGYSKAPGFDRPPHRQFAMRPAACVLVPGTAGTGPQRKRRQSNSFSPSHQGSQKPDRRRLHS